MANSMEEGSSYAKENIFLTCRCLYANEIIIMKSIFCQSVGRSVGVQDYAKTTGCISGYEGDLIQLTLTVLLGLGGGMPLY